MDSGVGTVQSSLADTATNTRCSSNDGNNLGGGGGANLAPRRSVGDFASFDADELGLADDDTIDMDNKSVQSLLSDVSGLFVDASEVERNVFSSEQGEDARGDEEDVSGSGRRSTGMAKTRQKHRSHRPQQQWSPTDVAGVCTKGAYKDLCDALSTTRSDVSDFTAGSDNGLIVGFVNRSVGPRARGAGLLPQDRARLREAAHSEAGGEHRQVPGHEGGDHSG